MAEHLTDLQIKAFMDRTLSPEQLLLVDEHLARCAACRSEIADREPVTADTTIEDTEEGEFGHLGFDQLAAYVDGDLDDVDKEIADLHFKNCDNCFTQLSDLRKLSSDLRPPSTAPTAGSSRRWIYFAVPVFTVLLIFLAVRFDRRPSEIATSVIPVNTISSPEPPIGNEQGNSEVSQPAEKAKAIVSLRDGSARIELDSAGKVTGLDDPQAEDLVANALAGRDIKISADVHSLHTAPGTLMGGGGNVGVPFALESPVGAIVETTKPTLRWRPLKGAESYRVDIFDQDFKKVDSSPVLKNGQWQVNKPLSRGSVYRWQVTALVNGGEIKSPVRPAPDAEFKILDTANASRVREARTKHANSHLIMGLTYAEAGLMDQAADELRRLVHENPDSKLARKLLNKVQAAR